MEKNLNELLGIVIITYNRKNDLIKTLDSILSTDSPIKDVEITVMNNNSDDGTTEALEQYCKQHPSVKQIVHPGNIGGGANAAYAFTSAANSKKYVWVLCDNDEFHWKYWDEIENAMLNDYDAVLIQAYDPWDKKYKNNLADIFYRSTFLPGCIYKTSLLTSTTVFNLFENIPNIFPHLALTAKVINDDGSIYCPKKAQIIKVGTNSNSTVHPKDIYVRGLDVNYLSEDRKNFYWAVGYFSSIPLIKDGKKQVEIIDGLRHGYKSLYDLFYAKIVNNILFYHGWKENYRKIYRVLNFRQKILFLIAMLKAKINLWGVNSEYINLIDKERYIKYFKDTNLQKRIDKLAKKYRGKKIAIYGTGLIFNIINENYDLSALNVQLYLDKKFKPETEFLGKPASTLLNIRKYDIDVVLFAMKSLGKVPKRIKKLKPGCKRELIFDFNPKVPI